MHTPLRSLPRPLALALPLPLVALLAGCGPSINPASKADIDARVAALRPPTTAIAAPGPSEFVPMAFAAGQWSQYKMVDEDGKPSFLTYKILGEEAGATRVELVTDAYHGRTVQQMLLFFGSRTDPNQLEIRAAKTKDSNGNVNEIPPTMMPMLQSLYKGVASSLVLQWQGLPQEAASAPAGNFAGCFKTRTDAQFGPWKSVSDTWSHPAVPITGLVRSKGVDKAMSMELVAYGLTGAKSEF
jgi:hypothetical protein